MRPIYFKLVQVKNTVVNSLQILISNPVLVYQMGKVGSSSVYHSLNEGGIPALHLHWIPRCVALVMRRKRKVRVITLVREPVGRRVSGYFQNLRMHTGRYFDPIKDDGVSLNKKFLSNPDMWKAPDWLEHELLPVTGIDVYGSDFPKEIGYRQYNQGNIHLLLLKVELHDSVKERVIAEFLKLPEFSLRRANESQNKVYAEAYREFASAVRLPENFVQKMHASRYARHFYDPTEIEEARKKWLEA